jgi:hypothetical protein
MTQYGQTPEGFRKKTHDEIVAEMEADLRAEIDPALDTSERSPLGQHIRIFARQVAAGWDELEIAEDGLNPETVVADQLIALCKLTGTFPQGATFTEVDCDCELLAGTALETNVAFASVLNRPDVLFTPKETFTAPTDGTHVVRFRAEKPGPVLVSAFNLTVIATMTPGWDNVVNFLDAEPGFEADGTNGDWNRLRERREAELAKGGSATVRALRADLLAITDATGARNVRAVLVLENDTDYVSSVNGLPPHSFECIVYDAPTVSNDLIAQTIFDNKSGGIKAVGFSSGTARDDEGNEHTVAFSRPTIQNIWLTYDLATGKGYEGDAKFKQVVVQALESEFSFGDDVLQWKCETVARLPGVNNVVSCKIGFGPSPTFEDDLPIGGRRIAAFDTTRVVIV